VKHINSDSEINPKTGKPYYYKDNPAAVKLRDSKRMYLNGKEVSKSHTLHKSGRYKSFQEAAFSSLPKYTLTKKGYVYILSNPAWEGWYKVGMAADINDRVNSYQTASPLRDYYLEHYIVTSDRRAAEKKIHDKLIKISKGVAGEWFDVLLSEAVDVLTKHTNEIQDDEEENKQLKLELRYSSS